MLGRVFAPPSEPEHLYEQQPLSTVHLPQANRGEKEFRKGSGGALLFFCIFATVGA